jgi:hypothetical protein
MSETALSNATSSEHFNRAAAALKAAERDAHAAIDSAVDGLTSAYSETKPMLSRVSQRARDAASDGYDAAREQAAALSVVRRPSIRRAAMCRKNRSRRC